LAVSDVVDTIRSAGFWDVKIRPQNFKEGRVRYADLDELIASTQVSMRGWPVPMIATREPLLRGQTWVGQDVDASMVGHYEAWRLYTSGQFNQLRAIGADWRHLDQIAQVPKPAEPYVEVWEILFYLTEVFELATRLALSAAGDEAMSVEVGLHGLDRRGLIVGQSNRAEFFEPYRVNLDDLESARRISREELVAEPRELAVDMAHEFFLRFGWKPAKEQLADHQRELTDRR
jgi:hypothetical protein